MSVIFGGFDASDVIEFPQQFISELPNGTFLLEDPVFDLLNDSEIVLVIKKLEAMNISVSN